MGSQRIARSMFTIAAARPGLWARVVYPLLLVVMLMTGVAPVASAKPSMPLSSWQYVRIPGKCASYYNGHYWYSECMVGSANNNGYTGTVWSQDGAYYIDGTTSWYASANTHMYVNGVWQMYIDVQAQSICGNAPPYTYYLDARATQTSPTGGWYDYSATTGLGEFAVCPNGQDHSERVYASHGFKNSDTTAWVYENTCSHPPTYTNDC